MKQARTNQINFKSTIETALENTLNFENHTLFESYDYEDGTRKAGSLFNLCIAHNYIIESVIPYLRYNSPLEAFNEKDRESIERRPNVLSYQKYGCIDYWWILLAVNGYFNASEFQGFTALFIPKKEDIESMLNRELFNEQRFGIIK
jgi:hypothetical protein